MRHLLTKARKNLLKFQRDENGNVAIIVAILLIPMLALIGGAIDIAHYITVEARLRAASESAALAAASLRSSTNMEKLATEYIKANLPDSDLWRAVNIDIPEPESTLNSRTIKVNVSITLPTSFLKFVGINELTTSVTSTATQTISDAEVAIVLDISSSMSRSGKIDKLKPAASDFVDEIFKEGLFEDVGVSLVPFGGTVNVGTANYAKWVNNNEHTKNNPEQRDYNIGRSIPHGNFTFAPDGGACIEYQKADFSDDIIPLASRPQVPDFTKYRRKDPWCPPLSTAMLLNSEDKEELKRRITAMELSNGTGMDIGALWGLKSLSPQWRGKLGGKSSRPADYDDPKVLKFMILMSDGEITGQYRPKSATIKDTYGRWYDEQTMVAAGSLSDTTSTESAVGYFKRICDDLRNNSVRVYTIGFQVRPGNKAEKMLQYCATNSSDYYLVQDLKIDEAFDSITQSINQLRIKG